MCAAIGFCNAGFPPTQKPRSRKPSAVCVETDGVSARVLEEWKKVAAKRRRVSAGVSSLEKTGFKSAVIEDSGLDQATLQELDEVMEVQSLALPDFDAFIPADEEIRLSSQGISTSWGEKLVRVIGGETSALSALARYRLFPSKNGNEDALDPSSLSSAEREEAVEAVVRLAQLSGSTAMTKAELLSCFQLTGFEAEFPVIPNLAAADDDFFPESVLLKIQKSPFRGFVVWRRGVGVKRSSGLLPRQKWLAVSERYLGWVRRPMDYVVESGISLQRQLLGKDQSSKIEHDFSSDASVEEVESKRSVTRVTPAPKWKGQWSDLVLPSFVQEPTYDCVIVFYGDNTSRVIKNLAKQTPWSAEADSDDDTKTETTPRLLVMQEVEWAGLKYYFPESAALPPVFEILRLDLVTIVSILTVGYQSVSGKDDVFIQIATLFSALWYTAKVGRTFIRSVVGSNSKLEKLRSAVTTAKGPAAVSYLSDLALENQFAIASEARSVLLGNDGLSENEVRRQVEAKYKAKGVRIDLRETISYALGMLVQAELVCLDDDSGLYQLVV